MLDALALLGCLLAGLPALTVAWNLQLYRPPPRQGLPPRARGPRVSVLIPARNEEASVARAVETARANRGVDLEVVVMDDHSEDDTARIVRQISRGDGRVRLEAAPLLPAGWCGKQHACYVLAAAADSEYLVFMDADVELAPDALLRMVACLEQSGADLASGIPRQETGTLLEKLVVPLIHFVLLGFLPMVGMRRTRHPAFAAGCGQLFIARRRAYERAGGHRAIRSSRHDGLSLPRAFRRAGLRTELFDATDLASCRMYRSPLEVWRGFAKNATEGMGAPGAIVPWTLLLFGGQVLPSILVPTAGLTGAPASLLVWAGVALWLAYVPRLVLVWRFHQSWVGALLHPLGILVVLGIQWFALGRQAMGRPLAWKGRT